MSYLQLQLEFMCKESSTDQQDLTMIKSMSILCQCLLTLQYLHESNSSIMRQDVKLSNILVQFKNSNYIQMKFEDFDLSTNYNHLLIICDTYDYLAQKFIRL